MLLEQIRGRLQNLCSFSRQSPLPRRKGTEGSIDRGFSARRIRKQDQTRRPASVSRIQRCHLGTRLLLAVN